MTTKVIPEKRIFICDCCGKEDPRRVKKAVLTISRHALDYLGQAAANGTRSIELCDTCESDIVEVINATQLLIREKAGLQGETKVF